LSIKASVGIHAGQLISKDGECIPLLLPLSKGGFSILYDDAKEYAYNLIQSLALGFFSSLGENLVSVHVFDSSLKNPFKDLAVLKGASVYQSYAGNEMVKKYNELEELIRYRHHELLSGYDDLLAFNNENPHKEIFHLLLLNIDHLIKELGASKDVVSFVEAAREAGIYTLLYGEKTCLEALYEHEREEIAKLAQGVCSAFIPIYCTDETFTFQLVDSHTEKLAELKERFGLRIVPEADSELLSSQANSIKSSLLSESDEGYADFLNVPIGTTMDGRTEINFALGAKSGIYHAFVAGTNGTGKTTLINNIILGIAKKYTAKEVKLFLMDYKQGVEFQVFENHPNCERLFLDNTNIDAANDLISEFSGLIEQRSVQFKEAGVTNIDEYNQRNPDNLIPRVILIIDEVHRLFSGNFKDQSRFEQQLVKVVKQGRSYGIHFIMSTQTLTGLNISSIMSQIPLRITFKLISSEVWKIYASNNDEPTKLGKFQFIYNTEAGERAGNVLARSNPPQRISEVLENIKLARDPADVISPFVVDKSTALDTTKEPAIDNNSGWTSKQIDIQGEQTITAFSGIDLSEFEALHKSITEGEVKLEAEASIK